MSSENHFSAFFRRGYNSPTLNTWASFLVKTSSTLIVLPLVLVKFGEGDVALWLLLSSIITFQLLFDMGFSPTFIRYIAYSRGKAKSTGRIVDVTYSTQELVFVMSQAYKWIGAIVFFCMLLLGTLVVEGPILQSSSVDLGWYVWGLMVACSPVYLNGLKYSAYMQGVERIHDLRRWETIVGIFNLSTQLLIVSVSGEVLYLIICHQFWLLVSVCLNFYLSRKFGYSIDNNMKGQVANRVWLDMRPRFWRSIVGVFMSQGLFHGSGFFVVNAVSDSVAASYLLALRVISLISVVSQAPFYTKIPFYSRLWSSGAKREIADSAQRSMAISYFCYVAAVTIVLVFGDEILELIGSGTSLPTSSFWMLLSAAFLLERYGAMHLQLYSISNDILWHIANGITGLLMIVIALVLYPLYGVLGLPLAMLGAYGAFYTIYCSYHSYREYSLKFLVFEKKSFLPPLVILLGVYITYSMMYLEY